jgi:hypothetical protein
MESYLYLLIPIIIFPLALLKSRKNYEKDFGWIEYPLGVFIIFAMGYSYIFEQITPLVIPLVIVLMVISYLVRKWFRDYYMLKRSTHTLSRNSKA